MNDFVVSFTTTPHRLKFIPEIIDNLKTKLFSQ